MTLDMDFVSKLLQALLLAIFPVLAGALVRWVLVAVKRESQRFDQQTLHTLTMLAELAVRAAEQAKLAGLIDDKKKYALEMMEQWFARRGVQIDLQALSAAIESEVLTQFPKTARSQ